MTNNNNNGNEKDFQLKVQRIGELVRDLENIADPESRISAKSLVQLLLDLHATGLERVMEIVSSSGDAGQYTIDDLGRDPLVGSLLVLYGLHPLDLETRVIQAIEKVQPRLRKSGGELELLGFENAAVRLHLRVTGHSCGSTAKTLKSMVEEALYEAAPDMNSLRIEGLDEESGSAGFVPVGKLGGVIASASLISDPS
ncbi:MAG: NifU family protein [Candidatus Sulfotelmatobacter sp.]